MKGMVVLGKKNTKPKYKPATTPEERENQLIELAYDLVEERLRDGTATSQETTHFLKAGSMKTQYEIEKLRKENSLLVAKVTNLESQRRIEDLYEEAIKAMRVYSGHGDDEEN